MEVKNPIKPSVLELSSKFDVAYKAHDIDEIKKNHAKTYETWRNQPHLADIPNGETLHIIKDRVDSFINELNEKYDNKHILLVSHSVTVRVMLLSFLNSGM